VKNNKIANNSAATEAKEIMSIEAI